MFFFLKGISSLEKNVLRIHVREFNHEVQCIFKGFWCHFTDKILLLRCCAHGCVAVLTYITEEEKIWFLRVFRSALLMYQCVILVFQDKKLHLTFACAESYTQVLLHSFQKSFQSMGH